MTWYSDYSSAAMMLERTRGKNKKQKLYWVPIKYRIDFKILLLTFKVIHNLAPQYLSELILINTPTCMLRSSSSIHPSHCSNCPPGYHGSWSLQLLCIPPLELSPTWNLQHRCSFHLQINAENPNVHMACDLNSFKWYFHLSFSVFVVYNILLTLLIAFCDIFILDKGAYK